MNPSELPPGGTAQHFPRLALEVHGAPCRTGCCGVDALSALRRKVGADGDVGRPLIRSKAVQMSTTVQCLSPSSEGREAANHRWSSFVECEPHNDRVLVQHSPHSAFCFSMAY